MLIYNEIQTLKELNTSLKAELESIKANTKNEIQSETQALVQNELANTLEQAKSHINAYASEKIAQSTSDLESYHAREVKRLFNARLDEILSDFSVDTLSKQVCADFANQNAHNASQALESLIQKHTSDFIKAAKSDIFNATQEALNSSREILTNAKELKDELTTQAGINHIRKYRFEASLHLSAMSVQSNLKELIKELDKQKESSNGNIFDELDKAQGKDIIHKSYATR